MPSAATFLGAPPRKPAKPVKAVQQEGADTGFTGFTAFRPVQFGKSQAGARCHDGEGFVVASSSGSQRP
jgi:hypothetical protein